MSKDNNLLYRQIKEYILEEMKSLQPRQRLASRTEFVRRYKVTRTTVDRAISELIGEGYLYSLDGSGTYVADGSANVQEKRNAGVTTWGVIMPDIMHDAYPGILRGIEDVAHENGTNILIGSSDHNWEKQNAYIRSQAQSGINGMIIVPAIVQEESLTPFRELQNRNIPFIFCNRGVPGIKAPRVISNSFYGSYVATRHLLGLGHRSIAYISRPWYSTSLERYQGYLGALHERSIQLDKRYVVFERSWDVDPPGFESTKLLMANTPRPDAIFCFNDSVAEGCYAALAEIGLTPGRDIGLIGYDDSSLCERLPVKLTSVKFQKYEIGHTAARMLLRITRGEPIQPEETEILMPELVIRASCGSKMRMPSSMGEIPRMVGGGSG